MIVQRNGETFKVDVQKEIEVILYFPKLEGVKKDLIDSNTILKDVDDTHITLELKDARKDLNFQLEGSMTDKGKELIDQAREVSLKKSTDSTRHKSKDGESHKERLSKCLGSKNLDNQIKETLSQDWPYQVKSENFWIRSKKPYDKDALSIFINSLTGETTEDLVSSLRNNSDFREDRLSEAQPKQLDKDFVKVECERLSEKVKEASLRFGSQPKSVEELIFNLSSAGKKEKEGKLYYELSWEFIEAMAKRMADNKGDKYERYNWKKNIDIEDLKQAINRHHIEVMKGNYDDGQELLGHIVSYATNSMMLWEQLNKN